MKLFNIFPHTVYLNSEVFMFSDINDDIEVVNVSTGKSVKLSKNNRIHLKLPAGENIFKCKYKDVEQEEKIYVEDAIKLGGSVIKNVFISEESPWILVIMKDRTYFHNRLTGMEFMEHKYTPDEVSVISEDYLLMTSKVEQTIFSMQLMKPLLTFRDKLFLDETHVILDETETESDSKNKKQVSVYAYNENSSDEKYKMTLSCEDYVVDSEKKIIYTYDDGIFYSFLLSNSLKSEIKKDHRTFICFTQCRFVVLQKKSFNKELFVYDLEKNKEFPILPEYRFPIISINDKQIENKEEYENIFNNVVNNITESFRAIEICNTYLFLNIWVLNGFVYYLIKKESVKTSQYGNTRKSPLITYILGCLTTSYEEVVDRNPHDSIYIENDLLIVEFRYETIVLKDGDKLQSFKGGKLYKTPTTFVYHKKVEGIDYIYNLNSDLLYSGIFDLKYINRFGILIEKKVNEYSFFYHINSIYSYFKSKVSYCVENINCLIVYSSDSNYPTIHTNGKILLAKNEKLSNWTSENGRYYQNIHNNKLILYSWDDNKNEFIESEILSSIFETKFFTDAYFANGGTSLIYEEKGKDKYVYFDINNNEETEFSSGKFIQNTNGYRPLVEFYKYRNPVIIDPVTLKKAPSAYLTDYNYISPDGRYRVEKDNKIIYYDKIHKKNILDEEYYDLVKNLDFPNYVKSLELKKEIINKRINFINSNNLNIEDIYVNYTIGFVDKHIVERTQYISVLDDETKNIIEINIGEPLWYLNYISFSYDNKYLAIAGRYPDDSGKSGLFLLYDINLRKNICKSEDTYAVWITAFNKQGKVAFYTSEPNTYIENISTINKNKNNPTFKNRSFLCYSHSGKYFALSIQGYIAKNSREAIREYWGHQPSSDIFIHSIENNKELAHFDDYGDTVKGVKFMANNIAFGAFSNDDKKLLTVGNDGVIFIRNLNLIS